MKSITAPLLVATISVCVAWTAYQAIRHQGLVDGRLDVQQRWDRANTVAERKAAAAAMENAAETRRRYESQQEVDRLEKLSHARDLAMAAAGAAAAERLRIGVAAIAARGRDAPGHPDAARQCQGDKAALAEGLARCGDDYQRVDGLWRSTYTAGLACERFSDSLSAAPQQ